MSFALERQIIIGLNWSGSRDSHPDRPLHGRRCCCYTTILMAPLAGLARSACARPPNESAKLVLWLPGHTDKMASTAGIAPATSTFARWRSGLTELRGQLALAACSESSSRREEALMSFLFPRKFEPRYLGCHGKWRFSTDC